MNEKVFLGKFLGKATPKTNNFIMSIIIIIGVLYIFTFIILF